MRRIVGIGMLVVALVMVGSWIAPASAQQDDAGCSDHPLFSRMPGYYIDSCEKSDFDTHMFYDKKEREINFEGKKIMLIYVLKSGGKEPSFHQIVMNYANAAKKAGGRLEYKDNHRACIHMTKDGGEAWVSLRERASDSYELVIVEKAGMVQEVTAGSLMDSLNKQGFVAVHINFDTNKATIKSESKPIIDEIVKMLRDNPDLNVSVEGHTDSKGNAVKNKALSKRRAESVVKALVKAGIDAVRLSAVGWGQEKPVADNSTEEGRAENRRVEIVKK
jgi:OOP family OmpA-OmpF porin